MIGIIDYGMGNLRSVQKAFERVGAQAFILAGPGQLQDVQHLVLPGVGAFADGMNQLEQRGWSKAIQMFIGKGRPFLGICLGMQLLFEGSQEDSPAVNRPVRGLGVLPGQVVRFKGKQFGVGKLKVPHMGWNTITWQRDDPLLSGLKQGCAVYFVHSYHAVATRDRADEIVSSCTNYGGPVCSSLWYKNIWATQFHPEKSQRIGLEILANFVAIRADSSQP